MRYDEEFEALAIEYCEEVRSLRKAAANLMISCFTLQAWRKEAKRTKSKKSRDPSSAILRRCFREQLRTGDKYAVNVVYVGILEGLKANCDNEAVRAFLKPVTKKEFDELKY